MEGRSGCGVALVGSVGCRVAVEGRLGCRVAQVGSLGYRGGKDRQGDSSAVKEELVEEGSL